MASAKEIGGIMFDSWRGAYNYIGLNDAVASQQCTHHPIAPVDRLWIQQCLRTPLANHRSAKNFLCYSSLFGNEKTCCTVQLGCVWCNRPERLSVFVCRYDLAIVQFQSLKLIKILRHSLICLCNCFCNRYFNVMITFVGRIKSFTCYIYICLEVIVSIKLTGLQ